jgi:hypothetical protein
MDTLDKNSSGKLRVVPNVPGSAAHAPVRAALA